MLSAEMLPKQMRYLAAPRPEPQEIRGFRSYSKVSDWPISGTKGHEWDRKSRHSPDLMNVRGAA
jgi:hypothetical protein